jgi:hypothetical protein
MCSRESLLGAWFDPWLCTETKKVRSHKNYPKYLEYNTIIHVGIMYKCIKYEIDKMIYN